MKGDIIRTLIRICSAGIVTLLLTAMSVVILTASHQQTENNADVIIVIGAGMSADGTLHRESMARAQMGIDLYTAGRAHKIHFSGGRAVADGPSAGGQMGRMAAAQGVPETAISIEERSLSTLQNALFSKPMLQDAQSMILVTEAFHLPRARASFWWMGYQNIHTAHAGRFRRTNTNRINLRMLGRETIAIWFNLGRAIAWSATGKQHEDMLH